MTSIKYPTGVENHGGFLRIVFMYQGRRVRESLGVPDTPKNRKAAGELRTSVVYAIKTGNFDYGKQFPSSSNLPKFEHHRPDITISELSNKWLAVKASDISSNTMRSYKNRSNTIVALVGKLRMIRSLKQEDVLKFRTDMISGTFTQGKGHSRTKTGRSVAYVNTCMSDFYSMLKFAQLNGYADINAVEGISHLKRNKKKPDPLTKQEFPRVIEACKTRQTKNLWSLAVFTGMRHGEICALAWEDVDLIEKTVTIRRSLTNDAQFVLPKTVSSERTIHLIDAAVATLRDQMEITRMRQPMDVWIQTREKNVIECETLTFVFNPKVNAVNNRSSNHYSVNSLSQTWRDALKRAGVKSRKAYQSRHTYACWSLSSGANPNFIAAQMGHSNAQMLYQVYGAWMSENDSAQVALLNSNLNDFAPSVPHTLASGE